MYGGVFIGGQSRLQMRNRIRGFPGQEQGVAERGAGGKERRVEPGCRLEIGDGLLRLIEMEQAGTAQELQIARIRSGLGELGEKRESRRLITAAVKRPCEARPYIEMIGCEFQGQAPLGGGLLVEAIRIVGHGAVKVSLERER